jgi:hypothetical protein
MFAEGQIVTVHVAAGPPRPFVAINWSAETSLSILIQKYKTWTNTNVFWTAQAAAALFAGTHQYAHQHVVVMPVPRAIGVAALLLVAGVVAVAILLVKDEPEPDAWATNKCCQGRRT